MDASLPLPSFLSPLSLSQSLTCSDRMSAVRVSQCSCVDGWHHSRHVWQRLRRYQGARCFGSVVIDSCQVWHCQPDTVCSNCLLSLPLSSSPLFAEAQRHSRRPLSPLAQGAPATVQLECTDCRVHFLEASPLSSHTFLIWYRSLF